MVFEELLPNMLQLSTDVFANCELHLPDGSEGFSADATLLADVVQKFFEQANQLQKTAMANVLEGHVLVDQQVRLIKELDGHVLKCARDAQSNHVIQVR